MADIFFDERKLPRSRNEYVAFIDIMGTRTHMKKSVKETANFIFKLHAAVISAWRQKPYRSVFVYPVLDGVYITSSNKDNMVNILLRVYRALAEEFMKEGNLSYLYLIRGALAFGEIIHGHNVPYDASKAFEYSLGYKDQILLGSAMISAYDGEKMAAPFGIYIDTTAQKGTSTRSGAFQANWKWFSDETLKTDKNLPIQISSKIQIYLDTMKDPTHPLHYNEERIDTHKRLTREYFEHEV